MPSVEIWHPQNGERAYLFRDAIVTDVFEDEFGVSRGGKTVAKFFGPWLIASIEDATDGRP